ncbi:MAG: hydroxymethylbilane synthase [Chloroflexota bacterium]|nr:hydroxymethylbilane synthase [Chloroflexota bacterium]MDE2919200.1 hydroxymethylbilane synthase [Chloroflexota bacterium]
MKARIATRRSPLARAQAALVADLLIAASPGLRIEFVLVDTAGDLDRSRAIETLGERGVFSRGVQAALLDGRADIAVHSYKDLPTEPLAGLGIAAIPVRADPRDALVSGSGKGLADLSEGAAVGTGSARRSAQVLAARPDLRVQPLRGNVGTRVERVRAGQLDAAVLAVAGLERAGLAGDIAEILEPPEFLPAPAQGALAVEVRTDKPDVENLVKRIDDADSRAAVTAERAFLRDLRGGCNVAAGALATLDGADLTLTAGLFGEGEAQPLTLQGRVRDADALGRQAAARVLAARDQATQ